MKTARFLLACAAVSVLAACGSQTITAPVEPTRPHADESTCVKITVLNADGTTSEVCASTSNNGGFIGSGG
jgi:uncharacterized lipoprotein YajG